MVHLHNFSNVFEEFLEPHFEWLAQSANVTDFRDKPNWANEATARSNNAAYKSSLMGEDDDSIDFIEAQKSARHRNAPSPYLAWALAGLAFVKRPCLHEWAIRRATMFDKERKTGGEIYESALISQAQVTVVNIESKSRRSTLEMAKIDEAFIADLEDFESRLDSRALLGVMDGPPEDRAVGYLVDSGILEADGYIRPSNTDVKDALSSEAVLMSLIAIANDKKIMSLITDDWLKSNGVSASKRDLLVFANVLGMTIVSSKEGFPPYNRARETTLKVNIAENAMAIGFFPAIMPIKLGQPLITSIKRETAEKLVDYQDESSAKENLRKHTEIRKADAMAWWLSKRAYKKTEDDSSEFDLSDLDLSPVL